ncbi:flagellar biosynthetic protein FliO [Janthinobacterium fluminis]|uniref:Flagellar protein n=1 Tax=Janthinobacterium fluminis TaxID=2987524 RepID=A0ABT5K3P8_9BURK|nr:flagellar biosynthetic protein FliO [Janthinobacterium fluminis]MDC8759315.1 flagellar biosynthetic protein FliO [Janthinobacterium fluminis]
MKPGLFFALALACCGANAAADAPPAAAPAIAASAPPASAPAALEAPAAAPVAVVAPALAAAPAAVAPAPNTAAGSLLQTILALLLVLALLGGLAWFMKRYGPKPAGGNARLRLLSSLSLGGRERIMLIEVAGQWIVVGASPGRVNALATLPRQESEDVAALVQPNGPAAANFSEWLKQTIEKRNGK